MNKLAQWEKEWFGEMSRAFMGAEIDRKWLRSLWREAGQQQTISGIGRPPTHFNLSIYQRKEFPDSSLPKKVGRHPKMRGLERIAHQKAMYRACKIVERAVKAGNLTNLREEFVSCVDCGVERATKYEHRDYAKPLEVQPVCQRCNIKRGPAILSEPVPTRKSRAA